MRCKRIKCIHKKNNQGTPTTKFLEIKYMRAEVKNVVEELEDKDEDLF